MRKWRVKWWMFRILSGTLVNKNISSNVKQVKKVNLFLRQTFLFKNSGISRHKKKKKKRGGVKRKEETGLT